MAVCACTPACQGETSRLNCPVACQRLAGQECLSCPLQHQRRSHRSFCDGHSLSQFAGETTSDLRCSCSVHRHRRCRRPSPTCQLRLGCIDTEYIAPRTWHFENIFRGTLSDGLVERDELLLDDHFYRPIWRFSGDLYQDHFHFYSCEGLGLLGLGLGLHAILSNTSLDQDFRDSLQENAVGDPGAFAFAKNFGETMIVVPGLFALWGLDALLERCFCPRCVHDRWMGDWARQSLRSLAVGAPMTGILQVLIGASRPNESDTGSRWNPFNDNNGVSGHAFVGAVPFLVAAKRTDNVLLKTALFLGSGLAAYSRIYDDRHYLSQALLGWWIAYLAVDATQLTDDSTSQWRVVPLGLDGSFAVGLEFRY